MNDNYENKISSDDNEKTKNEQNNINNIEKSELLNNDLDKNEAKTPNYKNDINNNNNLIQFEKINHIEKTDYHLDNINNNSIQFEKVNYINKFISKITREINSIIREIKELSINKIFEYYKFSDRNSIKNFFCLVNFFFRYRDIF